MVPWTPSKSIDPFAQSSEIYPPFSYIPIGKGKTPYKKFSDPLRPVSSVEDVGEVYAARPSVLDAAACP